MKLYTKKEQYKIYNGSMLDLLQVIEPNTIDAVVTDPPYEINFMNKGWDNKGIAFNSNTWKQCYETLKPGGYLLAFGATRTIHRIAVAIEDAGFEIRDTVLWLYGSGFPKSMNLSKAIEAKEKYGNSGTRNKRLIEQDGDGKEYTIKQTNNGAMGEIIKTTRKEYIPSHDLAKQWQGWGTALKPAYEPVIVARKPFKGSLVDNILENGVGGLNIDECRVETFEGELTPRNNKKGQNGVFNSSGGCVEPNANGRFPANVIHDGSEEVISGFPHNKSTKGEANYERTDNNNVTHLYTNIKSGNHYGDSGTASRYFYVAKASKKDRDEGLDLVGFEERQVTDGSIRSNQETARKFGANSAERKNIHPTVKPCELMQYLVRLVAPKGATILDPFMGSGSTGKAVMFENRERNVNYKFIGIDLTEEYCKIADARIDYALNKYEYEEIKQRQQDIQEGKTSIFDFI